MKFIDFLRASVLEKAEVERFIDPKARNWAIYDPEVGYTLGNFMPRDGIDGSLTISTAQRNGARTSIVYADRPCRINTYGNSFTQCHQVSDHETWQEYLAAHLGEPIRNFGMGGFGCYQSYRRMRRTESSPLGAENVLLYFWGDDHFRSVLRCRHALTYPWWKHAGMFHGNFWANLEMDLGSGKFVERDSLLPTRESMYKMTDPEFMINALKDDWMLQMRAFQQKNVDDLDTVKLNRLAEILGCSPISAGDRDAQTPNVNALCNAYGFAATKYIIDRSVEFAKECAKKLLIILYCPNATRELIQKGTRYDQTIADYLRESKIRHFDMNPIHAEDFKQFNIPVEQYMKRYSIGHYNPAGNHFFAFAIKNKLVDMLDPKPITYRADDQVGIDFEGYLPA